MVIIVCKLDLPELIQKRFALIAWPVCVRVSSINSWWNNPYLAQSYSPSLCGKTPISAVIVLQKYCTIISNCDWFISLSYISWTQVECSMNLAVWQFDSICIFLNKYCNFLNNGISHIPWSEWLVKVIIKTTRKLVWTQIVI